MQTWILDKNYAVSASQLDRRRLGAQIYEGIHVLASLLEVNDKLVTPKRSVKNHPVAKFWQDYEYGLYWYVHAHFVEWCKRGYKSDINRRNMIFLLDYALDKNSETVNPKITDNLIKLHKQVLRNKDEEFYGN